MLDAPELQDDFYLNLVDWSALNVVCVGLGHCVYLWSAHTSQVTRLCDLAADGDSVTSVSWNERVRWPRRDGRTDGGRDGEWWPVTVEGFTVD